MIYHIQFEEINVPVDQKPFIQNLYVETDKPKEIPPIIEKIKELKEQMDDMAHPNNPLFITYHDYDWHEKIEAALKIALKDNPDITITQINTYNAKMN